MRDYDYTFNIGFLGEPRVGKRTLINYYSSGFFANNSYSDHLFEFSSKSIKLNENHINLRLQIFNWWHLHPKRDFRAVLEKMNTIVLVYDVADKKSFELLYYYWDTLRELNSLPFILIGTKIDLIQQRKITRQQGISRAKELGMSMFIEVSTKSGVNVQKTFEVITEMILQSPKIKSVEMTSQLKNKIEMANKVFQERNFRPASTRRLERKKIEKEKMRHKLKQEFKINEYLTVRLEGHETNIYVDGELFNPCKYLMVYIPVEETEDYETMKSIDEISDKFGWRYDGQKGIRDATLSQISPKIKFWGHCSNLQAWYENDYDTNLLHKNLAFPLLKKLGDAGDLLAKQKLKEEIMFRFESGYPSVMEYLYEEGYFKLFKVDELTQIIKDKDKLFFILALKDKLLGVIDKNNVKEEITLGLIRLKSLEFFKLLKSIDEVLQNDPNVITIKVKGKLVTFKASDGVNYFQITYENYYFENERYFTTYITDLLALLQKFKDTFLLIYASGIVVINPLSIVDPQTTNTGHILSSTKTPKFNALDIEKTPLSNLIFDYQFEISKSILLELINRKIFDETDVYISITNNEIILGDESDLEKFKLNKNEINWIKAHHTDVVCKFSGKRLKSLKSLAELTKEGSKISWNLSKDIPLKIEIEIEQMRVNFQQFLAPMKLSL